MTTIHRTSIAAKCPHGGADVYDAEFHVSEQMVTVEAIQKMIDAVTQQPIYQEELTKRLATGLGCVVLTRGRHGRFDTECRAEL